MSIIRYRILLLFLIVTACSDWNLDRVDFPQVENGEVYNIDFLSAAIDGQIKGFEEGMAINHGHVFSSVNEDPTIEDNEGITRLGQRGNGEFTSQLTNLIFDTEYHVRAYVEADSKVAYSQSRTFRTKKIEISVDTISGLPGPEITIDGHVSGPVITLSQDVLLRIPIIDHGIVWSTTEVDPVISTGTRQSNGPLSDYGDLSIQVGNLVANTNYYFRIYLQIDSNKFIYSEPLSFHTFQAGSGWKRLPDFPGNMRDGIMRFEANGQVMVIGGTPLQCPSDNFTDVWTFNTAENTWELIGTYPDQGGISTIDWYAFAYSESQTGANYIGSFGSYFEYVYPNTWNSFTPLNELYSTLPQDFFLVFQFRFGRKFYFANSNNPGGNEFYEYDLDFPELGLRSLTPMPSEVANRGIIVPVMEEKAAYYTVPEFGYLWKIQVEEGETDMETGLPLGIWSRVGDLDLPDRLNDIRFQYISYDKDKAFLAFGTISTAQSFPYFWEFDPTKNKGERFSRLPDFPGEFNISSIQDGPELWFVDNKIYMGIGRRGYPFIDYDGNISDCERPLTNEFWEFTPPDL